MVQVANCVHNYQVDICDFKKIIWNNQVLSLFLKQLYFSSRNYEKLIKEFDDLNKEAFSSLEKKRL